MDKKELQVAALKNGTVIDHIPAEKVFTVVSLLGLQDMKTPITIGANLESKKLGRKGIIKVADRSVVADSVKLNIIRNYEVVEKKTVSIPDELRGIVKCGNPKCITNNEPGMDTLFHVMDKEKEFSVVTIVKKHNGLKRLNWYNPHEFGIDSADYII